MSSLPNWALGLLVLLAFVLIGFMHMGPVLQPAMTDVIQLAAESQEFEPGFYGTSVAQTRTGEFLWGRLENADFPLHYHGQNEIIYTLQGAVTMKFVDGTSNTIGPGQLVIVPVGEALGASGSGDLLLFTTPPENESDTVWLEGPMAKPGAKAPSMDKPEAMDVAQRIAQGLEQKREGFHYTFAAQWKSGSVELFRVDKGVALHKHAKENHVLYILKGHGRGTIGDKSAEVGPGQVIVIPANVPHKLERIGDEPLDCILFSTPPFKPEDMVWLK